MTEEIKKPTIEEVLDSYEKGAALCSTHLTGVSIQG